MMRFMTRFLPHEPDVLGMLVAQAEVTVGGMAALVAWTENEVGADMAVRDAEHEADERKGTLWQALRDAFVTPIAAEDIMFMSSKLDSILGGAKDIVREAEALGVTPDPACRAMAVVIAEGVGHLLDAFVALRQGRAAFFQATTAADTAHKVARQVEKPYREAMAVLLAQKDLSATLAHREIYRQLEGLSADITRVSDRIWYVAVKEG